MVNEDLIWQIQDSINSLPNASFQVINLDAERRNVKHRSQQLADDLSKLMCNLRKTEQDIADAKLGLFRLKDANADPDTVAANFRNW